MTGENYNSLPQSKIKWRMFEVWATIRVLSIEICLKATNLSPKGPPNKLKHAESSELRIDQKKITPSFMLNVILIGDKFYGWSLKFFKAYYTKP